jgi:hypothetical protein
MNLYFILYIDRRYLILFNLGLWTPIYTNKKKTIMLAK